MRNSCGKKVLRSAVSLTILGLFMFALGCGGGKLDVEVSPSGAGIVSRDVNLKSYPEGTVVTLTANAAQGFRFKEWTGAIDGNARTVAVTSSGRRMKITAVFEKFEDLEMVLVRGGTFTMGCTPNENEECFDFETPAHSVTLDDFFIMKYEVTQRLWSRVMGGNNPSFFKSNEFLPVEWVSYDDVVNRFIPALNEMTGQNFSLPTEAQWEYAARGGVHSKGFTYAGSNNIDDVAWHAGNSGGETKIVGTKAPNELGIHDMSGNVFELVSDWYGLYDANEKVNPSGPEAGPHRVHRGGGHDSDARFSRLYNRTFIPFVAYSNLGFRLVVNTAPISTD